LTASPLFQGSVLTKPLGANRVVINDGNNYATKLANQAQRTKTTSPAGWYPLGNQTISVDYSSAVPIYWVPQDAPKHPVTWMTGSPSAPAAMNAQSGLQSFLQAVPVPVDHAVPAQGNDKAMTIIEIGTGRSWSFWEFAWDAVNLKGTCLFAEYIPNIFNHPGVLPNGWGVSASGIALPALMNRMAEMRDGIFAHAGRLQVPDTTGTHIAPAARNDGGGPKAANTSGSNVDAVPEGLLVALPSTYVLPSGLTPFQRATWAQFRDYGYYVCDATGGTVNIVLEDHHTQGSGYCELGDLPGVAWPTPGFWDPYHAADAGPTNPWNNFPWTQLQQVAPPV
jgi:hypothetical protein